ncbi:hypothetical protein T265_09536 [Opisthorchis viverrini]|uniref:Uncharacterized protein n=1 Tax=Opisthorchis viverrini TaxID=6198 RepID=A0A074Z9W5_OPIVI|nr:hypothetical protein T265_09536 [Opisthorchis viverrini]KER22367.1 hypothetical protein T265_09536 [Opisthorchis viverrini]
MRGIFRLSIYAKKCNILTLKFLFDPQGFCSKMHCASRRQPQTPQHTLNRSQAVSLLWGSSGRHSPRVSVNYMFYLNTKMHIHNQSLTSMAEASVRDSKKYNRLQINLAFTRDSTESLVYDILQLNVLHPSLSMFQLARYSRYRMVFRYLTAMPSEGGTKSRILSGCPGLDRRSPDAEVGFEPWTFRNLVFTRDSIESLVYDILRLNVLHTSRLMFQLARYSRHRSIFS